MASSMAATLLRCCCLGSRGDNRSHLQRPEMQEEVHAHVLPESHAGELTRLLLLPGRLEGTLY